MQKTLRDYFPIIRTREEVLARIEENENLQEVFDSWNGAQRKEFLDFCTGMKGVKILYDVFFKEVFNPEYTPERLEEFLSFYLGIKVKIVQVLPNESTRIADETSLLVTDIVVELENGSLANIEIQKIGYAFPGQRSACYSADLLLRQYRRLRGERKGKFVYRDIKNVYLIVLFEKSSEEFHKMEPDYLHYGKISFDTGLELTMLQEYIFIALDIYRKNRHNKPIETKRDAWLTFLSSEEPETIMELIETYPEFRAMYKDIYEMCLNTERVMTMFSKELRELDRNTVQYMIDEMQNTIDEQKKELEEIQQMKEAVLKNTEKALKESETALKESEKALKEKDAALERLELSLKDALKRISELEQRAEK